MVVAFTFVVHYCIYISYLVRRIYLSGMAVILIVACAVFPHINIVVADTSIEFSGAQGR